MLDKSKNNNELNTEAATNFVDVDYELLARFIDAGEDIHNACADIVNANVLLMMRSALTRNLKEFKAVAIKQTRDSRKAFKNLIEKSPGEKFTNDELICIMYAVLFEFAAAKHYESMELNTLLGLDGETDQ